ncbi:hypothetical protein OCU04_011768 [Sclerotinia nivalis]|uniref:Uncharacterized protein n=1 Tax=Sclerotinia nivalis TaxID=352851 RepID=A0A9X0AAC1_9HELO|nr:hypothetical protein OCU04_011768 [Sclerotinia nivalis]
MNFLGSLFSSLRKAVAVSFSNNSIDDRFSLSVSSFSRLATFPLVVENAGRFSLERDKSSQIIVSPNGEEIHFSNVIDFIENHLDMPVVDTVQMIDMAKTQVVQVGIGLEDFVHRFDVFERTRQFYKQLDIMKEDTDEKYTKFVEIANRNKRVRFDIGFS